MSTSPQFELASHQSDAIAKLQTGKVLVGGTGAGKSITALAYFTGIDPTRKIYILTTAKKRDKGEWWEDAMKMSLRNELIVDSWNNIWKYTDIEGAFFILDEQRLTGKGAWVKSFYEIADKNDWIMLSATPADTWMDLVPLFIANGFYKNVTQFYDEHVEFNRFVKYPKVDKYHGVPILDAYRSKVLVEMPYLSKAKKFEHIIPVEFDEEQQKLLYTARWNFYEDRPIKDAGEMMRLMRISTNEHPSRYEAIVKLAQEHPRMIIFYTHLYELKILRPLMTELDIPVAEWNGMYHQEIPDTDRWLYLVQYQAGSEAWNCITTNVVVFYSLPYAYRKFKQAKGRIDRLNTTYDELHYYILKSRSIIDQGIWKKLHQKKSFNESAFQKKIWPQERTFTRLN